MARDDELVPWGPERLADLVALCDVALPGEELDEDTLEGCCCAPGFRVLGAADGSAAAAMAPGSDGDWHLQLLAVAPSRQGLGVGRRLVGAAAAEAARHGASRLVLGGLATGGRYLWPGVDARALRVLALAESCGARWTGIATNLACPSTTRAAAPAGVSIVRALDDALAGRAVDWVAVTWPGWRAEVERAVEHGTCLLALEDEGLLGFACHSVNRPGWFGPTAVDPAARGRGIGAALLGEACRDLMAAGHRQVEIAWVGPLAFYGKVAGAAVSRVFRTGWIPTASDLRG